MTTRSAKERDAKTTTEGDRSKARESEERG